MRRILKILATFSICVFLTNAYADPVDDFESGLPSGTDGNGLPIGFFTFSDGLSGVSISTTDTPPAPVPGEAVGNKVMRVDTNVVAGGFAGFVHSFENPAVDTWTPKDWTAFDTFSFDLYGNNTGSVLFIDILDNRNPGSTTDDAERFTYSFVDDFSGWRHFAVSFTDLSRKEIGNGAPNDGLTLSDVHGWAFGVLNSQQQFLNYIDNVEVQGSAGDDDGDSVPDNLDLCAATAAAAAVDPAGCSDAQVDGDGDGVCDPGAASGGPSMCTGTDAFPDDSTETSDNDSDGTGDNADTDDDDDGQSDIDETACGSDPLNAGSTSSDADNDGIPDCVDSDDDDDGVDDGDDVCPDTNEEAPTSNRGLNKNRWALLNGSNFVQAPPQAGSVFSFTAADTRGCSCSQIVDTGGVGDNQLKRGCSTSVMLNWINNP
jgi:hypothetical protein